MFRRKLKEIKLNEWMSNEADHKLLRSTWSDDFEEQFNIGSRIYQHLFKGPHGEAAKSLFPWIATYEKQGLDISEQTEFKIQALRLIQTIEQALELVHDSAKLESYLYKMGRRHVLYMPRLDPMYWETFQESVTEGMTARMLTLRSLGENRGRAVVIWKDIINFIFVFVQEGFYDGLEGVNKYALT